MQTQALAELMLICPLTMRFATLWRPNMEWQTIINFGLGCLVAAIGWFAREIWDSVKELRRDIHQIEKDLPEIYVRRDDLKEVRVEMAARFDKLESIMSSFFDRLNDKADK